MQIRPEIKFILLYLGIGFSWIVLSDKLLLVLTPNDKYYALLQTYKGSFYVIFTAIIFFFILKRILMKLRDKEHNLKINQEKLQADNEEFIALNETLNYTNKKMENQQALLSKIINLVPHFIFAKDKQGNFILVNKAVADLYGTTVESLTGKNHYQIHKQISKEEAKFIRESDFNIIENNQYLTIPEERVTDIANNLKIYQVKKIPFQITGTTDMGILGVGVDITEIKEHEKIILNQKEKLKASYEQLEADNEEFEALNEELEESYIKLGNYHNLVKQFQQDIIVSITHMLELHDSYTEGHSQNVAQISKEIANQLNLSSEEIEKTYLAGLVHDIGKILIPAEILNKNGPLSEAEYSQIKNHSVWGYQTLNKSDRLTEIANYILHHHEHWDGSGYPGELKGEKIPLISQILALADAWDAMCSNRPYRRALTPDIALKEIKKNKGSQFSPEIVTAFLKMKEP